MNPTQLPYLVEGILILASMIFGILLGRSGKPYGKVKLVIHLFLVLWFTTGFAFILYALITNSGMKATWIPIAIMGLMILTQLITGIVMIASGKSVKAFPMIHVLSASMIFLSDIYAFIIAGNPS